MINYDKISQDFGKKTLTFIDLCGFNLNKIRNFHILFVLTKKKLFDKTNVQICYFLTPNHIILNLRFSETFHLILSNTKKQCNYCELLF